MKFAEQAHFPCPFCGTSASVARVAEVGDDDEAPAHLIGSIVAVHLEPRCAPFEDMEAGDFLDAAACAQERRRMQARGVA